MVIIDTSPIAQEALQSDFTMTPEELGGLSLHEVTINYGTYGLYQRLNYTLQERGLADSPYIHTAVQLGLTLHNNDTRTNGHYADHLMRVTLRMIEHYDVTDPGLIAAGPLHDVIEDHASDLVLLLTGGVIDDPQSAREEAHHFLAKIFGSETADIVRDVSNPMLKPGEDKNIAYVEHTRQLVYKSPKARILKLSDFVDNAVGNHYTIGPKQDPLDRKYLGCYVIHQVGLFLPDSLIRGKRRSEIVQKLALGKQRTLGRIAVKDQELLSAA